VAPPCLSGSRFFSFDEHEAKNVAVQPEIADDLFNRLPGQLNVHENVISLVLFVNLVRQSFNAHRIVAQDNGAVFRENFLCFFNKGFSFLISENDRKLISYHMICSSLWNIAEMPGVESARFQQKGEPIVTGGIIFSTKILK
jgi:hypothetical protein